MNSIGLQLQFPFIFWAMVGLIVLTVAFAIVAKIVSRRKFTGYPTPQEGWVIGSGVSGILAGVLAVVLVALAFPYNPQYWNLYEKSGTVQSVSNILEGQEGGSFTSEPVVVLEDGFTFASSDPRFVTLDGQQVDLACSIEFVYQGADRYNCVIR